MLKSPAINKLHEHMIIGEAKISSSTAYFLSTVPSASPYKDTNRRVLPLSGTSTATALLVIWFKAVMVIHLRHRTATHPDDDVPVEVAVGMKASHPFALSKDVASPSLALSVADAFSSSRCSWTMTKFCRTVS